jgi:hypothetical protein
VVYWTAILFHSCKTFILKRCTACHCRHHSPSDSSSSESGEITDVKVTSKGTRPADMRVSFQSLSQMACCTSNYHCFFQSLVEGMMNLRGSERSKDDGHSGARVGRKVPTIWHESSYLCVCDTEHKFSDVIHIRFKTSRNVAVTGLYM